MKVRQAKKIVLNQAIDCRIHFNGPTTIRTGGRIPYAEGQYQKALRVHLRELDREAAERAPGAIERCADLNRKINADRLALLISRSSDWSPVPDVVEVTR